MERLLETLVAKGSAYEEETLQDNILTQESMVLSPHPAGEVHASTDSSPYLSLFDNTVVSVHPLYWKRELTTQIRHGHSQVASPAGTRTPSSRPTCRPSKTERIRQALVQLLPSQADTDLICSASHLPSLLNAMTGTYVDANEKTQFSPFKVAEISQEKITVIARMLLFIVVLLQQLDPGYEHGRLHALSSLGSRTERILSTVNALVTSDDELVTSMEGLEGLVLQGIYHLNAGSPRRAWLIFRRALSIGQLMGLQKRSASAVSPNARNMWHLIVRGDRYVVCLRNSASS